MHTTDRLNKLLKILDADPNDPFVLYGVAMEHARLIEQDADHVNQALEFFDRCLAADPDYFYAYFHKAQTLRSATRVSEAVEVVKAGLVRLKGNPRGDAKALSELSGLLDELTD